MMEWVITFRTLDGCTREVIQTWSGIPPLVQVVAYMPPERLTLGSEEFTRPQERRYELFRYLRGGNKNLAEYREKYEPVMPPVAVAPRPCPTCAARDEEKRTLAVATDPRDPYWQHLFPKR